MCSHLAGSISKVQPSDARHDTSEVTNCDRVAQSSGPEFSLYAIVGDSAAMRAVRRRIAHLARLDSNVLITGEAGTGKELVARAIHRSSNRAAGPFVGLHCGALPEPLVNKELFGYDGLGPDGASLFKPGRFARAAGGTLFFDEPLGLPLRSQARVWHLLEDSASKGGALRPVRLICGTIRPLDIEVRAGRFCEELYTIVAEEEVHVPPLRARRSDIPALVNHFLNWYGRLAGRPSRISDAALSHLVAYDWPGNVRQLESLIDRAVQLGVSEELLPCDLPEEITGGW